MTEQGFDRRTSLSEKMTEIMIEDVLCIEPLHVFRYGIEVFPKEVHNLLRETHTKNVQFVRYMPDALVTDSNDPENTYFMEFKVANNGIKKWSFLNQVIDERPEMPENVPRPYPKKANIKREDIFNVELSAHDLYMEYEKFIDIVIVGYATYYEERGLIANYNKNLDIVSYYTPGKIGRRAIGGSYTRQANIDQRSFMKLLDFMLERHPDIDENEIKERITTAEKKLARLY